MELGESEILDVYELPDGRLCFKVETEITVPLGDIAFGDKLEAWLALGNVINQDRSVAYREEQRILKIKEEAEKRIIAIAPEYKQRNMMAKGLVITEKLARDETLTAEEQTASDELKATWAQIDAIRTTADTAETDGTALGDITWPL